MQTMRGYFRIPHGNARQNKYFWSVVGVREKETRKW